jgi:hypothetical protein
MRQKMDVVPKSEMQSQEQVLYYGTNPPEEESDGCVFIRCSEEALTYFQSRRPYDIKNVRFIKGIYTDHLPVLFPGNADQAVFKTNAVQSDDIIASAFFFLSDWQNGLSAPDVHGRSKYSESIQKRLETGNLPVVNEYALLLQRWLIISGAVTVLAPMIWKGKGFALALTHDLDRLKKKTKGTWARETVDFLILNKNRSTLPVRLDRWQASVLDLITPGDTYQDSILKLLLFSENKGIRPTVFLQSGVEKHPNDSAKYLDFPFFDRLQEKIGDIGGEIGYHPGYESGYIEELIGRELHQLEKRIGSSVKSVRFHYLRFNPEHMPSLLIKYGLEQDSSIAWAENAGPRTGCVSPHTVFDRNKNRDSGVLEIPMLAMDVQLMSYMKLNISEAIGLLRKQVDLVARYNGVIVWNFHHQVYDPTEAPGWGRMFGESLNYAIEKEPYNDTFKQIARDWTAV